MSDKGKGSFAGKHGSQAVLDPELRHAVLKRARDRELPCAVAFDIGKACGVAPASVGRAADLLEVRLVKCQLGLFGYGPRKKIIKPAKAVAAALRSAILAGRIDDRLPCLTAWEIADSFSIHKMKVSEACEAMGIRIKPCQLGAF